MARHKLQDCLTHGIFSTGNLAELTSLSKTCVQKLCDSGKIEVIHVLQSKERRIPVTDKLIKFLRENNVPIDPRLLVANENYKLRFAAAPEEEIVKAAFPKASTNQPDDSATPATPVPPITIEAPSDTTPETQAKDAPPYSTPMSQRPPNQSTDT